MKIGTSDFGGGGMAPLLPPLYTGRIYSSCRMDNGTWTSIHQKLKLAMPIKPHIVPSERKETQSRKVTSAEMKVARVAMARRDEQLIPHAHVCPRYLERRKNQRVARN